MVGIQNPTFQRCQWLISLNGKRLQIKRKQKPKPLLQQQLHLKKKEMIGIQMPICQRCLWLNKLNGKRFLIKRNLKPKPQPLEAEEDKLKLFHLRNLNLSQLL